MKLRPRKFFNEVPVQQALQEYKQLWMDLRDDQKGSSMLEQHTHELDREIKQGVTRYKRLTEELGKEQKNTPPYDVIKTAMDNISDNIKVLSRVKNEINGLGMDYFILKQLRPEAEKVLEFLNQGDNAIIDKNGYLNSEYIKGFYAKSRDETWERFAPLDALYEKGEEFAINLADKNERAYELAKLPREIRRAKWKLLLSFADAAYSIDFDHLGGNSIDPNQLTLLSSLFSRLSDHERGSDNDHMPETHKYRHNPAIHSLHTLALADKIFHNVTIAIQNDPAIVNGEKITYFNRLKKMRSQIFLTALVHDMGEMEGELSQGITVAHIDSADYKNQLEKLRGIREEATFERHLDKRRKRLRHVEYDKLTNQPILINQPITEAEWQEIRQTYITAFRRAEKKDTFLGRFHKTLERMQSQQDYLRFQGLPEATPLNDSDAANKIFSVNYVPSVFYDSKLEVRGAGPNALNELANKVENEPEEKKKNGHPKTGKESEKDKPEITIKIQRMLTRETEKELAHLMERNIESYYGETSPETGKYKKLFREKASHDIALG